MIEDRHSTATSLEQRELERDVAALYKPFWKYAHSHAHDASVLRLDRQAHQDFLLSSLGSLSGVSL
jgi:hypothetical protein